MSIKLNTYIKLLVQCLAHSKCSKNVSYIVIFTSEGVNAKAKIDIKTLSNSFWKVQQGRADPHRGHHRRCQGGRRPRNRSDRGDRNDSRSRDCRPDQPVQSWTDCDRRLYRIYQGISASSDQERHPEAFAQHHQQRHDHQVLETWKEGRRRRLVHAEPKQASWFAIGFSYICRIEIF